jgi:hypothetical protein
MSGGRGRGRRIRRRRTAGGGGHWRRQGVATTSGAVPIEWRWSLAGRAIAPVTRGFGICSRLARQSRAMSCGIYVRYGCDGEKSGLETIKLSVNYVNSVIFFCCIYNFLI